MKFHFNNSFFYRICRIMTAQVALRSVALRQLSDVLLSDSTDSRESLSLTNKLLFLILLIECGI
jgi:hypothetical protein